MTQYRPTRETRLAETDTKKPSEDEEGRGSGSGDSTARTVGLGFLFILLAKGYFLVAGLAVQFGLPRLFLRATRMKIAASDHGGLSAERMAEGWYGDYGVASRTISWITNTMVQGTIQAVSKFVAEDEARAGSVKAAGLKVQAVIGGVLAAAYRAQDGQAHSRPPRHPQRTSAFAACPRASVRPARRHRLGLIHSPAFIGIYSTNRPDRARRGGVRRFGEILPYGGCSTLSRTGNLS